MVLARFVHTDCPVPRRNLYIVQDKFKASSGWVENFKHRHDIRKGGLWDKNNGLAWAMAANAKYNEDGGGESSANALNPLGAPMTEEQEGNEGDYIGADYNIVGGDGSMGYGGDDVEE